MLVKTGATVIRNLAIESHPLLPVRVIEYIPGAVYIFPFQLYGIWPVHKVAYVKLEGTMGTVITRLAIESQPLLPVSVTEYVPAAEYWYPFQK